MIQSLNSTSITFQSLSNAMKEAVANTLLKLIADSMFEAGSNAYEISEIKKMPKFVSLKKDYIETMLKDNVFTKQYNVVVRNILDGNSAEVLKALRTYTASKGRQLSKTDINALVIAKHQKKYVASLGRVDYDEKTHKTGYDKYAEKLYGGIGSGAVSEFNFE